MCNNAHKYGISRDNTHTTTGTKLSIYHIIEGMLICESIDYLYLCSDISSIPLCTCVSDHALACIQ